MSIEAYKVAVTVSLVDGVTRGLALMSRHFKQTDADAEQLQKRLEKIKTLAAVGAGLSAAGGAGLSLLKGPIEEAQKYQTELAKIASLGFGDRVVQHADRFAQSARIVGNSATQMAHAYGDALAIFKNTKEADLVTPVMARMAFSNQALYGEAGGGRDAALQSLMKVIEFRGGTKSDAEFQRQANMAQMIVNASRGRVDGRQMLQAMQTGGILAKMMTNKAFYLDSEPLIQEMGGFRFGAGLNAIYGNLGQGRGSILSQQELYRLGLLDRSRVQFNKDGRLKRALPGAFMGMDALTNGGVQGLLTAVLLPAFARAGITDPKAIQNEIGMIASNSRGAALLGATYQQLAKVQMQASANGSALDIAGTSKAAKGTFAGQMADYEAKVANLKLVIGRQGGVLDVATKALSLFSRVLSRTVDVAQKHPILTKFVVGLFGISAAAALVGGGAATTASALMSVDTALKAAGFTGILPGLGNKLKLVGAAFKVVGTGIAVASRALLGFLFTNPLGWAVLAITAVGVAAYELWKHWDTVSKWLMPIWNVLKDNFVGFINWIIRALNHIPGISISEVGGGGGIKVPGGPVRYQPHSLAQQHGDVYLDGKKVGRVVAPHLLSEAARDAGRPNRGTTGFDFSRSVARPGMAGR